jgi:16S rRNA (guanine(966)-N(2))-methyltransferase RsmD
MRIVAGKYKGRKLFFPKANPKLRPTKDMVKEAIFSILDPQIKGAIFLDVFAGVGSIGFEALSRGAEQVVFIEIQPAYIFKNAQALNCLTQVTILKRDFQKALKYLADKKLKYDLIYIDPPYKSDYLELALNELYRFGILSEKGKIIVETAKNKKIETTFQISKEKIYGLTKIMVLEH